MHVAIVVLIAKWIVLKRVSSLLCHSMHMAGNECMESKKVLAVAMHVLADASCHHFKSATCLKCYKY